jgi:hypothetical protein
MPDLSQLQQELTTFAQVGQAAASPFIKTQSGQATENAVLGEVQLGIAALPVLASLFSSISALFSHVHKTAVAKPTAPVDAPTKS